MSGNEDRHSFGRRTRELLEFVGARFAVWLILRVPPRIACALARGCGDLAYFLMAKRRRTAVGNILAAHVADDSRSARRIARKSFRSMALTVVESFVFPRFPDAKAEVVMSDETEAAIRASKCGTILVSGHLGNWEIGAQTVARFKPLTGISRRMNNARVQKLMDETKMRVDFETIDKHSGRPMDMVRALKRDHALAILSDQHASGGGAAIIDFFGRKAATYSTPAVLQHLTGAPIILVEAVRVGFMHFRVVFSDPIFYRISKESKEADVVAATQDLALRLEKAIRGCPEQYLWAHRRWKYAERMESRSAQDIAEQGSEQ